MHSCTYYVLSVVVLFLQFLRGLHTAYVAAVCNPFYEPGEKIRTQ